MPHLYMHHKKVRRSRKGSYQNELELSQESISDIVPSRVRRCNEKSMSVSESEQSSSEKEDCEVRRDFSSTIRAKEPTRSVEERKNEQPLIISEQPSSHQATKVEGNNGCEPICRELHSNSDIDSIVVALSAQSNGIRGTSVQGEEFGSEGITTDPNSCEQQPNDSVTS